MFNFFNKLSNVDIVKSLASDLSAQISIINKTSNLTTIEDVKVKLLNILEQAEQYEKSWEIIENFNLLRTQIRALCRIIVAVTYIDKAEAMKASGKTTNELQYLINAFDSIQTNKATEEDFVLLKYLYRDKSYISIHSIKKRLALLGFKEFNKHSNITEKEDSNVRDCSYESSLTLLNNACPYCGELIEKIPKTKCTCSSCKNPVYLKPSIDDPNIIVFLTSKQKDIYYEKYNDNRDADKLIKEIYNILEKPFDLGLKRLEKRISDSSNILSRFDNAWAMVNEIILEIMERKLTEDNLKNLKMIYFEMALIMSQKGKPWKYIYVSHDEMDLRGYKLIGVNKVDISFDKDCECYKTCKQQFKKSYSIKTLLENKEELMGNKCMSDWCTCMYLPSID